MGIDLFGVKVLLSRIETNLRVGAENKIGRREIFAASTGSSIQFHLE